MSPKPTPPGLRDLKEGEMPEPGLPHVSPRLVSAAWDLLQACKRKLADCRKNGDCSDAALREDECCSDECAQIASAVDKAEGRS